MLYRPTLLNTGEVPEDGEPIVSLGGKCIFQILSKPLDPARPFFCAEQVERITDGDFAVQGIVVGTVGRGNERDLMLLHPALALFQKPLGLTVDAQPEHVRLRYGRPGSDAG